MAETTFKALLIEDSEADAGLIQEALAEAKGVSIVLKTAKRLSEGLEHLRKAAMDVVLLDLNLPDSEGMGTLARVREIAPKTPVVVLTGMDQEGMGDTALQLGAQDYISKKHLNSFSLVHSLRYAILRNGIRQDLQKVSKEIQTGEFPAVRKSPSTPTSIGVSQDFPPRALDDFQTRVCVRRFTDAFENAANQAATQWDVKSPFLLRSLAMELGRHKAGPRDVLDICNTVLEQKAIGASAQQREANRNMAVPMLLHLMGHLIEYYREASPGQK